MHSRTLPHALKDEDCMHCGRHEHFAPILFRRFAVIAFRLGDPCIDRSLYVRDMQVSHNNGRDKALQFIVMEPARSKLLPLVSGIQALRLEQVPTSSNKSRKFSVLP